MSRASDPVWLTLICPSKGHKVKGFSSARFPGLLTTAPGSRKTILNYQGSIKVDIPTDPIRFDMLFSGTYQTVYAQIVLLCVYTLEQTVAELLILHLVNRALENRFLYSLSVA